MLAKCLAKDGITGAILSAVALSGGLITEAVVPAALKLLPIAFRPSTKYNRRRYLRTAILQVAARGLIKFSTNKQGRRCVRLTSLGHAQLKKYEFRQLTLPRPKHWDGKYRLIMFDIKEWKRGIRDELRRWLEHLGFVRLQNSVWVYPHECQQVIILLKSHFHIGHEVLYVTAQSLNVWYFSDLESGIRTLLCFLGEGLEVLGNCDRIRRYVFHSRWGGNSF